METIGIGRDNTLQKRSRALARLLAHQIETSWADNAGWNSEGFQVVIHVLPGQTKAKILWPAPSDLVTIE